MKIQAHNNIACLARRREAWTIIELLIAMFVSGLLVMVIAGLTVNVARSIYAMSNYSQLDQKSRQALDILTRDIRQAKSLSSWSATNLNGTSITDVGFSYLYNPTKGTLTRTFAGATKTLLTDCDSLTFAVYQRTPTNNFQFYKTTSPAEAKLVDVNWKCSRKILGEKVNTETIQTAKIVIRN